MILDALDWIVDGSLLRLFACVAVIFAAVTAAIIIPLWLTGCLDGPTCPPGKSLILIPIGKTLVPQCV